MISKLIRHSQLISLLFPLIVCSQISAEEKNATETALSKKYQLSICALFKDEADYLKEWIEYHRLVGVDHFYLYNNNSADQFVKILNFYIKKGMVTLVHWPDRLLPEQTDAMPFFWALGTQATAYEHALRETAAKETEWLLFMDIKEFLVPSSHIQLKELLKTYANCPGILLSSEFFDASKIDIVPRRKLLIETVELTDSPTSTEQEIQKSVAKMIVKPTACLGFSWPPYQPLFKEGLNHIALSKEELHINYYANRYKKGSIYYGKLKDRLPIGQRLLTDSEMRTYLALGYEIEDQKRPIYRFIPDLLTNLGF
jgi:hypothetical protein